ncbi:MAG: protein-disulfide reductase DsbD family protein, partial [Hyphomicrobium sp.]|nr:protein-disulfide reductase DsbD family protein [Hyphomicrobium sp.]
MFRIVLAFLLLSAWLWPVAAANAQSASRVAVSLHAGSADPAPGKTTMLAIRFTPDPGWHGYWSNPGDSGLPPKVKWQVPAGVRIGALQHPAPELLRVAGMTSFVHGGQHVLLAPMQVPVGFKAGDALPVKGTLDFLICSDKLCVPQKATVDLNLTVGKGTVDPASLALFASAKQAIPTTLPTMGEFMAVGRTVQLLVPAAAKLDPARATFFPAGEGVFER